MTDKQTEALRLADKLEFGVLLGDDRDEAAAELRRLHQSEREGWRYADEIEQERKRLHEVNAELVEALKAVSEALYIDDYDNYGLLTSYDNEQLRAALAKAQGGAP